MKLKLNSSVIFYGLLGIFALCCIVIQLIDRSEFGTLMSAVIVSGATASILYRSFFHRIKALVIFAVCVRLLFLISMPNLSDDFFRFFWDGLLLSNGVNPASFLPNEALARYATEIPSLNQALFEQLNSQNYFTIYPPISQAIFAIAAWLSPNSIHGAVIIMKVILISADIMNLYLIYRLLKQFGLENKTILFWALNPLVLIELSGNLHFEGLMIFFFLGAIFFLTQNKIAVSGIFYTVAILTKMIPLLYLPFLIKRFWGRRLQLFTAVLIALLSLGIFATVSLNQLSNIGLSFELYFRKFEFNASLYYFVRKIGFLIKGYNIIEVAGISLSVITFTSVITIAFLSKKKDLLSFFSLSMFASVIFLALSTTVHPWYICFPLVLSIFTKWRFIVVWSCTAFLSYYAYSNEYQESMLLIALEYFLMVACALYEWTQVNRKTMLAAKT